jgi:hypothetical protein
MLSLPATRGFSSEDVMTKRVQVIDQKGLDALALRGCATPGCDHKHHQAPDDRTIYLDCRRCIEKGEFEGLDASYRFGDGVVVLTCRRCRKHIIGVLVSE